MSKGMGAIGAKPLPHRGLPRSRPFYAAHLRALGSLPNQGLYMGAVEASGSRPASRQSGGDGGMSMGSPTQLATPTAHVVAYVK